MKNEQPALKWHFELLPANPTWAEIEQLELKLTVTNQGSSPVSTDLHLIQLLVNGKPNMAFGMRVSNGIRSVKWDELPAGESMSEDFRNIGKTLFPEPGTYELDLHWQGESQEVISVELVEDE